MRVLLVGDTHAHTPAILTAFKTAEIFHCDRIFQLGDFGYWPRAKKLWYMVEYTSMLVTSTGIPLYFLAGNHEDWDSLDTVFATHPRDDDGFYDHENLKIAPKSNVWTWDDMNFANLSGAFSIDREGGTLGWDWFIQEIFSDHDRIIFEEKIDLQPDKHIDVMLAHDAPVNLYEHQGMLNKVLHYPDAKYSQQMHAECLEYVQPHLYVHGHWHYYYKYYYDNTFCVGLDMASPYRDNRDVVCMTVLDTEERTLSIIMFDEHVIFELPEKAQL